MSEIIYLPDKNYYAYRDKGLKRGNGSGRKKNPDVQKETGHGKEPISEMIPGRRHGTDRDNGHIRGNSSQRKKDPDIQGEAYIGRVPVGEKLPGRKHGKDMSKRPVQEKRLEISRKKDSYKWIGPDMHVQKDPGYNSPVRRENQWVREMVQKRTRKKVCAL